MNAVHHDGTDYEEGSMIFQESFEYGEFDLGECVVPLKTTNELPRTNSLRNITQNTNGPLPPSPAIVKKKNMARVAASPPNTSPGSLVAGTSTASATLNGRRAVRSSIQNPLGGSLHGRGSSPGPIGGGRLGRRPRTRSNSPSAPLVRSRSPRPLGGSLHNRTSSPTALVRTGIPMRRRSNSPGSLKSASLHGTSSLRPRSRSPGALQGRNRSFRLSRRMSLKNVKAPNGGMVSILRKGKYSGVTTSTTTTNNNNNNNTTAKPPTSAASSSSSSSLPAPPGCSPPGSPQWSSSSSHHRKRLLPLVGRRVTFWFPDEQSLACSFATEESMAFADLGFDDSGEGFGYDEEYGQRSIRGGELAFIEVMGDDARRGPCDDDDDDDDYLVKRFNGSTIHEELGASFGEGNFGTSFSYLPSDDDEDEDDHDRNKNMGQPPLRPTEQDRQQDYAQRRDLRSSLLDSSLDDLSQHSSLGSFALPVVREDAVIGTTKKSKNPNNDEGRKTTKDKSKNKNSDKSKGKRNSVTDGDDSDHEEYDESFCQGSFALPDSDEDKYITRKPNNSTKQNKLVGDSDDDNDQGSRALPDLEGMPRTKRKGHQSKKTKNQDMDKDSSDDGRDLSCLPDLADRDDRHNKSKNHKNKGKIQEKKKDRAMNKRQSLTIGEGSFALPDSEEDIISHKKMTKKNKNMPDTEDSDVDRQESLGSSQGSFNLADSEEDVISHKKKTKKNKNKDVSDRQESLDASHGSFALADLEEDIISHKKRTKKNPNTDDAEDNDVDRNESFCVSQGSFTLADNGEDQVMRTANKKINHKETKGGNIINKNKKEKDSKDDGQDSFGQNQDSFVSLVFAEDETMHKTNKSVNPNKDKVDENAAYGDGQESFDASQGSFALPDSMDSSSLSSSPYHQYSNRSRARQQHPLFCQLPRSRRRNPTPPPSLRHSSRGGGGGGGGGGGAGSSSTSSSLSSFSSSLRLEEALMTPVRQKTPQQPSSTAASWCCSESSLELSALRDSSKTSNRDSLSETSSESPTSVTELGGVSSQIGVGGDENGLSSIPVDDEDTEHRRLTVKRSMVSTLVPPIG